ncbi:sigma 54-interacting transcriptional regulator [Myxococcus landrumensis]|uniref:Sigma 54-interacting transcriptional regulator n=1 Tax=Myxococcus landrumensis TaxID=2813577 RepID=A0ABX7NCX5_9BACT|nr:sigma 54-interacting transcriptional regulator [Myxococcus landrumus]QSQ16311.1 sigma 54-interacting transcriptional regulator [Myxococcus landrumus]
MTRPVTAYAPRSERKPLYVKVVTLPALAGCWAVNISETGIGLIATPRGPQEGPREGEPVELSFSLPDSGEHIRAWGDVRWRHETGGAVTALGVFLHSFEDSDGVKLARYLATARLQVVVAFASEEEAQGIRAALEGQAVPHFAASAEEAQVLLARGDAAALLVCGRDEARALALVETFADTDEAADLSSAGPASDLASRIIYCAPAAPERLVALFNAGLVFRAPGPSASPEAVRQAVLQAGRERGVRTEQWRMALELERTLLRERALSAEGAPKEPGTRGEEDVGLRSVAMQRVMEMVRLVAPHRVAVLLQGETGTGKEVLARSLHRLSGRGELPLVVQDCGALTETLLESELFGHVRGAFTNAVADHPGLFVLANGGTIFLDEIENTTPNLQAKLLRVLETGDVRPVGGTQVRHVDVRVLAASNRDLGEEVRTGRFRADLFYRLNSFTIDIPPLRERPEDVPELARFFLLHFNRVLRRSASGMSQEVEDMLRAYPWPGNVRELRNVLERAVLLSRPGEVVSRRLLPPGLVSTSPARNELAGDGSLRARLERVERELIREALERHGGVLRRAAVALGMDPVTLGRRARRHGLWKQD